MSKLITINGVSGYLDKNGVAYLKLENVARGLGFTQRQNKGGKFYESIRWERVSDYLTEIGFPPQAGENESPLFPDFIPENIFYKLCFKASNATARAFQNLVTDEILPSIRKHGIYATEATINKILADPDFGIALLTQLKEERQRNKELAAANKILAQENETLEIALNEALQFYTVAKYNKVFKMGWNMKKCQRIGRKLTAYCQTRAIIPRPCETNDERFSTVNSYPVTVWEDFLKREYPWMIP